jgi:hypothetical protein
MRSVLLSGLAILAVVVLAPGEARAQGYGPSSGSLDSGGGTSYLPYGGGGGFLPYSPGPGGGLGVQPRMAPAATRAPMQGAGMSGVPGAELGRPRSRLAPLRPLSVMDAGMGGGPLLRRPPAGAGGMGRGMARPPVGYYPFRQPPSLVGPSGGPSMSM